MTQTETTDEELERRRIQAWETLRTSEVLWADTRDHLFDSVCGNPVVDWVGVRISRYFVRWAERAVVEKKLRAIRGDDSHG